MHIQGNSNKLTADLPGEIMEARRQWLEGKRNCQQNSITSKGILQK